MFYRKNDNQFNAFVLWLKTIGLTTVTASHCVYALSTSKKEKSVIVKKYDIVKNGFTEFMIIDNKDNHFNVANSLWFWKWNSIEDWSKIKEGDEMYFRYYGWRVPLFGLFPNIYMLSSNDFQEMM